MMASSTGEEKARQIVLTEPEGQLEGYRRMICRWLV